MADEFNSAGEYNDMSYSGHDSSMERIVSIDFDQVLFPAEYKPRVGKRENLGRNSSLGWEKEKT